MIFDGVLGNIQARRDFLVRKTLRHQANQLLLPEREIGSLYRRSRWPAIGTLMDVLEQVSAEFGWANRRKSERRPHGGDNI